MKHKVLFLGDLNTQLAEYKRFAEKYECVPYTITTREQTVADFKTKFADVRAIYGAWLGFVPVGGFNDELVANAPPALKIIAVCSVGHDNYHGAQMKERGIVLTNVPSDGAAEPVADLVLYNAIAAFRQFRVCSENFTIDNNHTVQLRSRLADEFDAPSGKATLGTAQGYHFGHVVGGRACLSPRNHNVVIVGFGKIGQTIGARLHAIGMKVHYVKRSRLGDIEERALGFPVQYHRTLNDTVLFADLVVIACPATPETHHLVNKRILDSFANPVRIINIGRGPVIDEQALVDSLKSGNVVFAGLDVFEDEPKVHAELFGRQDVVLTPHVGASTVENFDHTAVEALRNIDRVLSGDAALHPVN